MLGILAVVTLGFVVTDESLARPFLLPLSTGFQIKGLTLITLPSSGKKCQLTLAGDTNAAGSKKAKAGAFTAASTHTSGCLINFSGLPWNIALISKSSGFIQNVTYDAFGKFCGPVDIAFSVSKRGLWNVEGGSNSCTWTGSLKSTPTIRIGH
jgi:hypothetical protein